MVNRLLAEVEQGTIDLTELWVARQADVMVGALLAQVYAGRTAALWPPEVSLDRMPGARIWRGSRNQVAADLIRQAVAGLRDAGVRVVQTLIERPGKAQQVEDLKLGGMPYVTDLIYLSRLTAGSVATRPTGLSVPRLVWAHYSPTTAAQFQTVLEATYEQSLDMPELMGARSLDDIQASHRATGHYQDELWQIGYLPQEPAAAAVLLMLDRPDRDAMEVAYLGLTPAARGRGLGRATVIHALEVARPLRARLELAVDSRNTPAKRLYTQTGFRPTEVRGVHLVAFRDEPNG